MTGIFTQLKANKILINTNSKSFETNHFTAVLFLIFFSGISTLLCFVLLTTFGNEIILFAAFAAPAIVFYIYTLADDIVNPLLCKIVFSTVAHTKSVNDKEITPKTELTNEKVP